MPPTFNLSTQMTLMQQSLTGLEEKVDVLTTNVAVLVERVDTIAVDVIEIKREVLTGNGRPSLKARVAALEAGVATIRAIGLALLVPTIFGVSAFVWALINHTIQIVTK